MPMNLPPGTSQPPAYPIIDSHVHIWVNDPKYPWAKETTHPPRHDATPEMLTEGPAGSLGSALRVLRVNCARVSLTVRGESARMLLAAMV